jgi:ubiquinone/menaquinone biosynthesis C-methylase UbiE
MTIKIDEHRLSQLDTYHQKLYTEEAPKYELNRFHSKRGRIYNYYELRAMVRLLEPLAGKRLLDVASGTGRAALAFAAYGAKVTSLDLTWNMLSVGNSKAKEKALNNILFITGNGYQLPFDDNTFDILTNVRFLHLLPPSAWPIFLSEMRRVLKPDGLLMVQLYNPFYGGPLALVREGIRWIRKHPREKFVWPHQIHRIFDDFSILSISSFWLPGMGILGSEKSAFFDKLSQKCTKPPISWISGPHLVLAKPDNKS